MLVATRMPLNMSLLVKKETDGGSWVYKPWRRTALYAVVALVFDYTAVLIVIGINGFWIVSESCVAACLCFGCWSARHEHCAPIAPSPIYVYIILYIPTVRLQVS